jgi:hypothetical protein
VDAVGPDEHVAAHGHRHVGALAAHEGGGDAVRVLGEVDEAMIGPHGVVAQARPRRGVEHALEHAAMDRELRIRVPRVETAGLAPDRLAEPVGVDQLRGADADLVEGFQQAQRRQLLDGMGQHVEADAELPDAARLLEHLALDPDGVQAQRRRQPADPGPDDECLHARRPTHGPCRGWRAGSSRGWRDVGVRRDARAVGARRTPRRRS